MLILPVLSTVPRVFDSTMPNCNVAASYGEWNSWPIWVSAAVFLPTATLLLLCAGLAGWWRRRMRSRWTGATGGFGATVKPARVLAAQSKPDPAGQHSTVQLKMGPTEATDWDPNPPAHYENVTTEWPGGQGVEDDYAQNTSAEGEYMEYTSPANHAIYANGPCAIYSNCPTEDPNEDVYVFPDYPPEQERH